jgi:hypothetical protein
LPGKSTVHLPTLLSIPILFITTILVCHAPVYADPQTVTDCSFSNPVAGRIGLRNNGQKILGSNPNLYNFANSGKIDFSCSSATILTISDPIQLSGATMTELNTATIDTPAGLLSSPSSQLGNKYVTLNASVDRFSMKIDMENSSTTSILSGNYVYKVILTVTVN